MRKSTRFLALVLTALMLVGMVPFSLFAVEGDTTASDDTSGKTYAEQVADYVAKNNGILYFAQDWNGEITGTTVPSLVGGKASMSLVPKTDTVSVIDGAVLINSAVSDPFMQFSVNQNDTANKDMVIEGSYKNGKDNPIQNSDIMFVQEYLLKNGKEEITAYRLLSIKDGNYATGRNKKPLAVASSDEFVNIKVVAKFALNAAYYYVNNEFVCADQIIDGTYDYFYSKVDSNGAAPSLVRYGHISGAGVEGGIGLHIDDTYVYAASVPYGCTMPETNSYVLGTLADYLSDKGERLLFGVDFDGDSTIISSGGVKYPVENGTELLDDTYIADPANYGKGYGIYNSFLRNSANLLLRASHAYVTAVNGNNALAVEQSYPYNGHTYMDIPLNGHVVGSDFVASVSVKRFDHTNFSHTLLQWRWNDMGKGESGTAADGTKATWDGVGNKDFAGIGFDAQGRLFTTDYSKSDEGEKVYVGQLTSTEFNDLSVVYHVSENTADIYFNGHKVVTVGKVIPGNMFPKTFTKDGVEYTFDDFTPADWKINSGRINLGVASNGYAVGGHYLDNIVAYTGTELENIADDPAPLSGWVQENGYWRYYDNGVPLLGEHVIAGETYYFEKEGAYASEKVRYELVDLEKTYSTSNNSGDTLVNGVVKNTQLGPSTLVKGSGKYTYLWRDIYKDSNSASGNANIQIKVGASYTTNNGTSTVTYNSMFLTNRETLLNDGDVSNNWIGRLMRDGVTYANLNSYYALEYVAYSELENPIGTFVILGQDNWGTNIPGYTTKWKHASGMCGRQIKVEFVEGWETYTHFLDSSLEFGEHEVSFGHNRDGGFERILYLSFQPGWSSTNTKYQNYDKAQIYFDNFYIVDYVPTKTVPAAGFRTTAEGTYYYAKTYEYATGWQEINGGKYYFYPYNGLMAVGNAVVEGVGMTFDENGKLLDETATGWFTVDGIECIYVDGVLQTGAFEYDGKSYYASYKGEIFSDIGEIGYVFDKPYSPTYLTSISDVMLAINFDNQTVGGKVGNHGAVVLGSNSIKYGGSELAMRPKLTYFTYVDEGNGNVALEVNNNGALVDSYVNINLGYRVEKDEADKVNGFTYKDINNEFTINAYNENGKIRDLVFEFDIKLNENWAADALIFQPIGVRMDTGARANEAGAVARVNEQGYVYVGNDKTKVICKLDTESYTNLAFVVHQSAKTADIYINGVLMVTGVTYHSKNYEYIIMEGRTLQYPHNAIGTACIDNVALYLADKPAGYDGTSVGTKNGWVTEGGVQRYYIDGLMRTSALQVAGPNEGDPVRYYYFNAKNGMCEGVAEGWLDGKFYEDGIAVTSKWIEDEKGTYYVNTDGTLTKGVSLIDGVPYYFNKTTGVLEKNGIAESRVILGIDDIMESLNKAKPSYTTLKDGLNYTAKVNSGWDVYNVNGLAPMDISDCEVAAFDIWLGGEYKGDFLFLMGFTETFYHLAPIYKETTVTDEETGETTVTKEITGYKMHEDGEFVIVNERDEVNYKWTKGAGIKINGTDYVLWTVTNNETGAVEYYARQWIYQTDYYKFENLQPGWNTIYVPLDRYSAYTKAVTQIGLSTNGWGLATGNGKIEGFGAYEIVFGEVRAIKLADLGATLNDGWVEFDGNEYYYANGVKFTGYKQIDGLMYQFAEDGRLLGKVNGKLTVTIGEQVYDEERDVTNWVTYEAERIYVEGVYQTGEVDFGDATYICDAASGAIVKGETVMLGQYVYDCDDDGVATPHNGWYTDADGNKYYTSATGKLTTGQKSIEGAFYFFDTDGKMVVDQFVTIGKSQRYQGPDGKAVTGIYDKIIAGTNEDGTTIYKTAYFASNNGFKTVPEDGIIEGVKYVFDEEGFIIGRECAHVEEVIPGKAPTCTETGLTEGKKCSVCGTIIVEQTVIEALGHTEEIIPGKAATCTETGLTEGKKCSVCGTVLVEQTVIEALGHTEEIIPGKAATCTETGLTDGKKCSVCGTVLVEQTVIEMTDHVYDNDADADCNVCGAVREISAASGKVTNHIEWKFENGTLTITGEGRMPYYSSDEMPWYSFMDKITNAVIGEGVTVLGRSSFNGAVNLESVTLPETLTAIDPYAFFGCKKLTTVEIPAGVTSIGAYAFMVSGVKTVTFGTGYGWSAGDVTFTLDEIEANAAELLKNVFSYDWVRDEEAEVEEIDPYYVDGGACGYGLKWILRYTDDSKTAMKLTISGEGAMPDFYTGGAPWYEYALSIVEIEVHEGVTRIGRCAFYWCKYLNKVTLPETVTEIGDYAFNICWMLTTENINLKAGLQIGKDAFQKTGVTYTEE